MKNLFLKFKIIFTNLCRIVISFLFVTITTSKETSAIIDPTCYMIGPSTNTVVEEPEKSLTVFFVLVPIAIVIIGVIIIIRIKKKKKNESKETLGEIKNDDK